VQAVATLKSLSDPRVLDGGEALSLVIETDDAPPFPLKFTAPEAADLVHFICGMATAAAVERASEFPPTDPRYYFAPIPATGIGFAAGRTPDTTVFVLNLSGFPMTFEVPSSGLADMADELVRIARTLSAGGPKGQ
jgi:hypothetical protein